MRTASALRTDLRFQWRHGFYYAYSLICACYMVLLQLIPEAYRAKSALLITFSDPSILGLYFAGGIVLLERGQGLFDSLFVTPFRVAEYIAAKMMSLALLSLITAFVIHGVSAGWPEQPFRFGVGILLTSTLFTLLGILAALPVRSLNGFILLTQLYALPMALPLLDYFGCWESPIWFVLPTQGTLVLLDPGFVHRGLLADLLSSAILLFWNVGLFILTVRSFKRHVLYRIGGEAA